MEIRGEARYTTNENNTAKIAGRNHKGTLTTKNLMRKAIKFVDRIVAKTIITEIRILTKKHKLRKFYFILNLSKVINLLTNHMVV